VPALQERLLHFPSIKTNPRSIQGLLKTTPEIDISFILGGISSWYFFLYPALFSKSLSLDHKKLINLFH
jgi:hypothetical protein